MRKNHSIAETWHLNRKLDGQIRSAHLIGSSRRGLHVVVDYFKKKILRKYLRESLQNIRIVQNG